MMAGKLSCRDAMSDAYRQRRQPAFLQLLLKIIGCGEFSQRLLDRDLPRAGRGHHDKVGRIRDGIPRLGGQGFISQPPEQGVCVQQQPHSSCLIRVGCLLPWIEFFRREWLEKFRPDGDLAA